MQITKQFEVEMAHYVPNATSYRCSHSTHGHSYKIFVTLGATKLDNAQMIYDFGLLKGTVKSFIDSMDHSLMMYAGSPEDYKDFFKTHNDRWIETPFIPSAEMMSVYILKNVKDILTHTVMANGEKGVKVVSVEVYETRSGSAKCNENDILSYWDNSWKINYSEGIKRDWCSDLIEIMSGKNVSNPKVKTQVDIPIPHKVYTGEFVKYTE